MFSTTIKDYIFQNINILKTALTHPSIIKNENNKLSYERMEFLGDSILNIIIAELSYRKFTNHSEGELSIVLAKLVSSKTIILISKKLNLGQKLILNKGEEKSNGRNNLNNLENALEAIIAAIYLDSDFKTVKRIVSKWWWQFFQKINILFQKDYKSQLQELLQKKYKMLPEYKTKIKKGKEHNPIFKISVSLKDKYKFEAKGKTKKQAEQNAAKIMINFINKKNLY